MMESKICNDCWYYVPDPTTNKILDDSESLKKFPHCEFYNDFKPVKSDDACEHWESKKLKLIGVIRTLYGLQLLYGKEEFGHKIKSIPRIGTL